MAEILYRPPKVLYYLGIAEAVSRRSTCLRKHWGSVIVHNDSIVSTGYNGAPRNCTNCSDTGRCYRMENHVARGTQVEKCQAVHSEQNAIIMASADQMKGATLFLYGYDCETGTIVSNAGPCVICRRMIINAGIQSVVVADMNGFSKGHHPEQLYGYRVIRVADWLKNFDQNDTGY